MEELQPQELEELVQELEGAPQEEESLPSEVEALLQDLQPARRYAFRRRAAKELGEVSKSNRQIVQALVTAAKTDTSLGVRAMAEESLRAPAHQAVLQQYPELSQRAQPTPPQEKRPRMTPVDETDTGQSQLAYRLAAAVLLLNAMLAVANVLVSWALNIPPDASLSLITRIVIDVALAVGLFQLRKGARTWVLIRAGVGAILLPIDLFMSYDPLEAALMSVIQWGFSGALLLLLTGQSKTWRLAVALACFVVFALGLSCVLVLLALLVSVL